MNNVLKYVKLLENTGITREQAEAQVQMVTEILENDLATKQDLKNLEHKILELEYRLIIKLGTIVTLVIAAATTVIKLL